MRRRLTKAELLAATVCPTETVAIPELGGEVLVRGMSGLERDGWEATLFRGKGKHREVNLANARAKLVALCCIDDQGHRMFSDDEAVILGQVRGDVLNRLFTVAQKLSGLSEEELDELGQPIAATETPPAATVGASSSLASPEN